MGEEFGARKDTRPVCDSLFSSTTESASASVGMVLGAFCMRMPLAVHNRKTRCSAIGETIPDMNGSMIDRSSFME